MQRESHKNWLLMIAEIYAPAVVWTAAAVTFIVIIAVLILRPVYQAQTTMVLDSDLTKVLRGISTAYPSQQQGDFIRYEYFATHNVALMRLPHLAEKLIEKHGIKNLMGRKMFGKYFIHPDFMKLVLWNNGQGVDADWITDTQQFSITGYAKDPKKAVLFSDDYTKLFLEYNCEQFRGVLNQLVERLDQYSKQITASISEVNREIIAIKKAHHTSDATGDLDLLSQRLESIQLSIETLQMQDQEYQKQKAALEHESENYSKLLKCESSMSLNPQVTALKSDIQESYESLSAVAVEYTPEHPAYAVIEERLKTAQDLLKTEAETILERETAKVPEVRDSALSTMFQIAVDHVMFELRLDYYTKLMESRRARMCELNEALIQIDKLERQRSSLYDTLTTTSRDKRDIGSILGNSVPFFRVVAHAYIDETHLKSYKYFPKRSKLAAFTFLGVFFFFVFVIIGREIHRNVLYRGWQLSEVDLKVDHVDVPYFGEQAGRDTSVLMDSLIRPVILASADSDLVRVSSVDPGEGRATCAMIMARHFARTGKTVVLVDGDAENKSLSLACGAAGSSGLLEYLRGEKRIDETVIHSPEMPADIMPAGSGSLNDASCHHDKLAELIAGLRGKYDKIVFVDTPASSTSRIPADALPTHNVLIVVRSGRHSSYDMERIARECALSHAVLKGVVFNRTPFAADMFSVAGLVELARYIIMEPIGMLKRFQKTRQSPGKA